MNLLNKFETGDYQTPLDFCDKVFRILVNKYKIEPNIIVEPTCGLGNFLLSSTKFYPIAKKVGIELNDDYIATAKNTIKDAIFFNSNIFDFDFDKIRDLNYHKQSGQLLFVGNPPWVTNSSLSSIGSFNLPLKDNFKKNTGLDAITGKSNFDICEYILLQLLSENTNNSNCYLAFLCKEIVAKNILRDLNKYSFKLEFVDLYSFSASKVFDVSCDAVLFVTKMSKSNELSEASFFNIDAPSVLINKFGWKDGKFISNLDNYSSDIDGNCQLTWRQGIKHDCSKVMELMFDGKVWKNKYGEIIDFADSEYIYPLVKSSGFKNNIITDFKKRVIVTQHYVREDTEKLKEDEKLYSYLVSHKSDFDNRKSVIYKNTPPFSIFGIGDYSFYKYKIGISGFYKTPKFCYLSSSKPVMVDDTCYFIGTNDVIESYILYAVLDNDIIYSFLESISFKNSKRPFTKDILQRIDLIKGINKISKGLIIERIRKEFDVEISNDNIQNFINKYS